MTSQISMLTEPTDEQLLAAAAVLKPVRHQEVLLCVSNLERGFPPTKVGELLHWLDKHLATIPAALRDTACLTFESIDSDELVAQLKYTRPETEDEFAQRVRTQAVLNRRIERGQRRQYEFLRAKFETSGCTEPGKNGHPV